MDLPCPYLEEAANKALAEATEEMGYMGADIYARDCAKVTEQCIKPGCLRTVTIEITAPQITIPSGQFGLDERQGYSIENSEIKMRISNEKCRDNKSF
ncbi:hypothetical protein FJY90_06425 [Candidatus Gottesmanbacteria bacterium]|nr:hypothetical protein [Candidatus Gottesmanbacteria bacterium]